MAADNLLIILMVFNNCLHRQVDAVRAKRSKYLPTVLSKDSVSQTAIDNLSCDSN
jgi:hypothetical protein